MATQKHLKARRYGFYLKVRQPSKSGKPRRVSLVAQRRIVKNGKIVTAGGAVQPGNPRALFTQVSKPKLKQIGTKLKGVGGNKVHNVKVGNKWKRTAQAGG